MTESDCKNDHIAFVDAIEDGTRIRFDVFAFEDEISEDDRERTIVPFQLAYAVSIHKAQGLEYKSVKVIIPSSNAEKITYGIFYTAITRAKEQLKIYWSSETMQKNVAGFSEENSRQKSLAIIKETLDQSEIKINNRVPACQAVLCCMEFNNYYPKKAILFQHHFNFIL